MEDVILKGRRVIFVLGNLELGGAERQALILARHLVSHEQATVEVWGFNKSGPVANICEQHGITWKVVPYPFKAGPSKRLTNLLKLSRLLRAARPDILLPYTLVPNVACGLIWKRTGARVCVWNQRDEGLFSLDGKWERWSLRRTSHFISNSQAGARFLTGRYSVDPGKVRVIKNGIDHHTPKLDRRAWRERLEIDESSFVACMVANLHNNKDHATLLNAWREVVMKLDREAVLVLAGRYDVEYESLVALARELKVDRNVRFAGHITDVPGLLSAVEIGVFSSRSEGCPNGVLECMAAGLAVVGTDIEGVREIVSPNGFHLLAPPGDASELAQIIVRLADDPGSCSTIGERNRSRVREQYNAQRMCEETVACLEELL